MFDDFFLYMKKKTNEALPIFLCLEYYLEFLEKKITQSRSAPLMQLISLETYVERALGFESKLEVTGCAF